MAAPEGYQQAREQFADWRWRLNNLYWITDKRGARVPFRMNWAQESLFNDMHFMCVILKARQLGFTTFIQIFMLDVCLFNDNVRAGTIAHNLDAAKAIFRDKVKYPYENLPEGLRSRRPVIKDSADELMFVNNSSIRVGTSLRSGTLQYLHVSEYGKLCAQTPDKAREVRTGALNTVHAGQIVFIESTGEGQEGHYFDICENAQAKERAGTKLTPLDFKFYFFPWWKSPEYVLDPDGVPIPDEHRRYFAKLKAEHGIVLQPSQQAWYVKKAENQLAEMKREYPSIPKEAFEASVEGAYYSEAMAIAEHQGRIGEYKADPQFPVNTAWDIGVGDYTVIWFFQVLGGRIRLVGYFQNSGEGMPYYLAEMKKLATLRGWKYGQHFLPHDGAVKEWGTGKTREEQMRASYQAVNIVPRNDLDDGINATRTIIPICEFDEADCADGIKALKNYRKEWDEERGIWKDRPRHDWASHGADGFRTMASRYPDIKPPVKPKPQATSGYGADTGHERASVLTL
jgi:hypothetical protein